MWIRGAIETKCVLEHISDIDADQGNSLTAGDGGCIVVNGAWKCHQIVHGHALRALAETLNEKRRACTELRETQVFVTESTIRVRFGLFVFSMDPLKMRTLAPYCCSDSIAPNGTSFDLNAVLLSSARGQKEFLELTSSARVPSQSCAIFQVPKDIIESSLVRFLTAKDVRMLNKTCRFFRFVGGIYVPGLRPQLFKHQRASLILMERQEMNPCSLDDAFSYALHVEPSTTPANSSPSSTDLTEGASLSGDSFSVESKQVPSTILVDAFSGLARTGLAFPSQRFKRGGLLCDAPGLGKTVAMLSLILRTRGMRANETDSINDLTEQIIGASKRKTPPRDAKVRWSAFSGASLTSFSKVKTTLVIVPRALMSHWTAQIKLHVEDGALSWACMDSATDPFPEALESLDVLFISSSRLALEMRRATEEDDSSPLRHVCFLRMIIDEGHVLGSNSSAVNLMQMVRAVRAERFWIVTGTPARLSSVQDGLVSLRNTFRFLGACPPSASSHQWAEFIQRGFREESYPAKHFLVSLLRRIMVRHRKEDVISELPILERTRTLLRFDRGPRLQYNIFVSFVRSNVLLTSIGSSGGSETSLLHPNNRKACVELVNNLRVACSAEVNERFRLAVKPQDLADTLALFSVEPTDVYQRVSQYLNRAVGGELSQCGACGIDAHILIVTRCGHLFCVDCAAKFDTCCSVCGAAIDADDLAALQPGFSLTRDVQGEMEGASRQLGAKSKWILDRVFEERARFAARNQQQIGVPPPKFIVFSQFQSVLNVVGDKLIHALGQDAVAEFWRGYRDLELEKFKLGRSQEWRCTVCNRLNTDALAHKCPLPVVVVDMDGSPHTLRRPEEEIQGGFDPQRPLVVGVDVFVREGETHRRARVMSLRKCGGRREKDATLYRDVHCDVLLLPKDGSHGVDLSCASHVFLLDVLWDAGVEEQIVSRAWRLGNKAKRVVVEQLLMRDTLEDSLFARAQQQQGEDTEAMFERITNMASSTAEEDSASMPNARSDMRLKTVLEEVKLVRPFNENA